MMPLVSLQNVLARRAIFSVMRGFAGIGVTALMYLFLRAPPRSRRVEKFKRAASRRESRLQTAAPAVVRPAHPDLPLAQFGPGISPLPIVGSAAPRRPCVRCWRVCDDCPHSAATDR